MLERTKYIPCRALSYPEYSIIVDEYEVYNPLFLEEDVLSSYMGKVQQITDYVQANCCEIDLAFLEQASTLVTNYFCPLYSDL